MSGRSSANFPSPRFSSGTPSRSYQSFGNRQPLYLQPNCPYLSPRGSRIPSPRNSSGSPDFIPLGVSSPVSRARQSWNQRNHSNNSNYSGFSSPPSSNSSPNYSPYKRYGSRGNFRDRRSFGSNHSGTNSPHISLYVDKEALEDPWAELEKKQSPFQSQNFIRNDPESNQNSTTQMESDDEVLSGDDDDDDDDDNNDDS